MVTSSCRKNNYNQREVIMNQKEFLALSKKLLEKMQLDNYSTPMLEKDEWILKHFGNYCSKHKVEDITLSVAADFTKECFGFDLFNPELNLQSALRYPLLTLFEFKESGNYAKTHHRPKSVEIPTEFSVVFHEYGIFIESCEFKRCTRLRHKLIFARYVAFLYKKGIYDINDSSKNDAYDFIDSMDSYAPKTLRGYKISFRFALDWLFENKYSKFSGQELLPVIHFENRSVLISYYSKEEISTILNSIDTTTKRGKFVYCVMCFFVYLGIRSSDVAALKLSCIDWNHNTISFEQFKTKQPIVLPLLDEVKYPLLDYLKNARPESEDNEHIFIKSRAPHTYYSKGLYNVVSRCIKESKVDTTGKHFGPHALRHSLATNLLAENVPISGISDILGHSSTITTEIYLSVDETHLKEISLEVPEL
jgi:integrase